MTNLDIWRDGYYAIISKMLLLYYHVDASNFDGPLLKKDTENGTWLWSTLGYVSREHSTTALETVMVHLALPAPNGCISFKLEVRVRRHTSMQVYTFPAVFGVVVPPAPTLVAPAPVTTSGAQASTSGVPAPTPEVAESSSSNVGQGL